MVWVDKLLRWLFRWIDMLLGWAVDNLYKIIIQIANVDIFGDYIYEFMGRIYVFLAVFMLFKLSISVVNYILNPDQLTDKSKGFQKIIQNVIIVIGLLIMVPTLFSWAYQIQSVILNTNVLYTIVTGKKNNSNYDPQKFTGGDSEEIVKNITEGAQGAADMLKYELLSTFIYGAETGDEEARSAINSNHGNCYNYGLEKANATSKFNYNAAYSCLMADETINNTSGGKYGAKESFTNEYKLLISTACIGFTAYVFLIMAFDVALRCVKLGVLQLIAPIPVISMLDPNSGKNGMFSKWLKECSETYLSLFIRLIGVYFAIEIIKSLSVEGRFIWYGTNTVNNPNGIPVGFGFTKVFVILGVLMFAKQLPQFIATITGFKMDGGGLSLKKKLGSVPGLGRATAGAIGLGGGLAANALASRNLYKGQGFKGFVKGLGSTLAGGMSGSFRGMTSKEKNAWKAGQGAIKGSVDARNLRDVRQANHDSGIPGMYRRAKVAGSNWAGIESGASRFDKQISAYDQFLKQQADLDSFVEGEINKRKGRDTTSFSWTNASGATMTSSANVNVLKQQIESLKAAGASAIDIENAEREYNAAMKQAKIDYINDNQATNVTVKNAINEMNYTIESNRQYDGFSSMGTIGGANAGTQWDNSKGTINDTKGNLRASEEYRQAQINKKNDSTK